MSETVLVWALIVGLALVSFLTRAIFILPGQRLKLGPGVERVLRFAPAAALMAIIVPDIVRYDGVMVYTWENPRLVAGLVAFAVAAVTRNIMATIVAGLVVLWLLRAILA